MAAYRFRGRTFQFERYPLTNNRSLRPVSAADELLIVYGLSNIDRAEHLLLQHDRFGVLGTVFSDQSPQFVETFASQKKALLQNLAFNGDLPMPHQLYADALPAATSLGLMRVPKSIQLFERYVSQFAWTATSQETKDKPILVCGFMTRHFSPGLLKVAEKYAGQVEQSRATKKARLLILSEFKPRPSTPLELINELNYKGRVYRQYYGVFSADKIDYGTQFLLEYLSNHPLDLPPDFTYLDLACGNGILANEVAMLYPKATGFAIDDSHLATSSAILNLDLNRVQVIQDDDLGQIPNNSLDLLLSNPPFHFGHETNIEVSLRLFREALRVLRPNGQFLIVANRHLNYSTHLRQLFSKVKTLDQQQKFELLLAIS